MQDKEAYMKRIDKTILKSTWTLVFGAVVLIAALVFLSSGKKAPFIPSDDIHRAATTEVACAACHASGKQAPLKASHPPKEQCLICHKVAAH
jgi:hypothetical protein